MVHTLELCKFYSFIESSVSIGLVWFSNDERWQVSLNDSLENGVDNGIEWTNYVINGVRLHLQVQVVVHRRNFNVINRISA